MTMDQDGERAPETREYPYTFNPPVYPRVKPLPDPYVNLVERVVADTMFKPWNAGDVTDRQMTMCPPAHLRHLQTLCHVASWEGIEGDFCECGVWRGGAAIVMAACIQLTPDDRDVWVVDSFDGMSAPRSPIDEDNPWSRPAFRTHPLIRASETDVIDNFVRMGLWGGNIRILPGFVEDTLPGPMRDSRLAILRSDVDLYSPTWTVLETLYDRLEVGGFYVEDDYFNPRLEKYCRAAVDNWRDMYGVTEPVMRIPTMPGTSGDVSFGAYWRKERQVER